MSKRPRSHLVQAKLGHDLAGSVGLQTRPQRSTVGHAASRFDAETFHEVIVLDEDSDKELYAPAADDVKVNSRAQAALTDQQATTLTSSSRAAGAKEPTTEVVAERPSESQADKVAVNVRGHDSLGLPATTAAILVATDRSATYNPTAVSSRMPDRRPTRDALEADPTLRYLPYACIGTREPLRLPFGVVPLGAAETAAPPNLPPGVVLIRGLLTLAEQHAFVAAFDALHAATPALLPRTVMPRAVDPATGVAPPPLIGYMYTYNVCCGTRLWDSERGSYTETRALDGLAPPPVPPLVPEWYDRIFAHPAVAASGLPKGTPDIASFNYYPPGWGDLGVHRDRAESTAAAAAGHPVVSISIGGTARFAIFPDEDDPSTSEAAATIIYLNSGDVLLFGGPSRMIRHGLKGINFNQRPAGLRMKSGRLNITIRTA